LLFAAPGWVQDCGAELGDRVGKLAAGVAFL
jgi:hypothetical protein